MKCTKRHLFHPKWPRFSFRVKIVVISWATDKMTTVIFFSAWDKSRVKWDNPQNSTQKMWTYIRWGNWISLSFLMNFVQSCILLNYVSVISSIFINKFDQKCQYFTLMDQSVPLITVTSLIYLGRNRLWLCLLTELRKNTNKTILTKCICFYSSCLHTKLI